MRKATAGSSRPSPRAWVAVSPDDSPDAKALVARAFERMWDARPRRRRVLPRAPVSDLAGFLGNVASLAPVL